MKKKLVHKKKGKRYFNFKKHALIVTLLLVAGLSYLFLPGKNSNSTNCANSVSCIKDLSGNYEEEVTGEFEGKTVTSLPLAGKPQELPKIAYSDNVLGDTTSDAKKIYIDLSKQRLYAFENNTLIYEFPVSTGKWGTTPTGDFRIWIKLRYTRMQGGSKALGTYYNLPNVPYTMYFYNESVPKYRGYGIHGAYWHNNFGHPMSHGCINMRESDVAQLYTWANPPSTQHTTYATADNPGTLITIYGITPKE